MSDKYEAALVPDTAVNTDQKQKYLLVVGEDKIVKRQNVDLGRLLDDGMRVVLKPKLPTEAWIIVEGMERARLNYPVEPVPGIPAGRHPVRRVAHARRSPFARSDRITRTSRRTHPMLSNFFIDRPIFATVLSIVIVILGAVAFVQLPIAQYPEVAPPVVQVSAIYPGANAKTVAETVATPIELEVNGVERMLYMSSQCTNDGQMYLDVTFEVGTNLDMAQVLVQNRVSIAEAKLPEEVKRQGVTTKKKSPAILLCVNLISPDASYDQLYLSNFALMNIKDDLARLKGVGDVAFLGPRDYSMRVWLDPNKLAFRGMTVGEVVKAIREQNIQVAAGRIGQPPVPEGMNVPFQLTINTQGRIESPEGFDKIIVKTGARGENVYLKDVVRETKRAPDGRELEKGIELGAKNYDVNSYLDGKPAVTLAVFQLPGSNALKTADAVKAKMRELKEKFPAGVDYAIYYDTTVFVNESIHEVYKTLFEAFILVFLVVLVFLQDWRATIIPMIAVPVSLIGTFAIMAMLGFSLNNLSLFGLVLAIGIVVDDAIVVVENVERYLAMGHPRAKRPASQWPRSPGR